ncbi:MAG: ribokinase [Anaerolineae bacterium]|nr:ribokinase [Anaerolineae bacterium]
MQHRSQPLASQSYLVIGHVTKDLYPGGYKIGGTATFSALTARNLGHQTRIVTCCDPDLDLSSLPDDLQIEAQRCEASTTFENIYHDGHRRQFIRARARALGVADVPEAWRSSRIVHLGPLDQEVDEQLVDLFPAALIGLTPQGWMRRWDEQGLVSPVVWSPSDALLARADAVILSEEDVGGDLALVESFARRIRVLVLTAGWQGSTVYAGGRVRSFPSPQVNEVDPTGAGDIFAAAFLSALAQTGNPWRSAQFANCVAAHSVERSGPDSIPTRDEIARCLTLFNL